MMATFSGEALLPIDRKVFAASFAQQHSWFLDQLEPGSAINTMTATVEVSSALLPGVLETSLNLLVERHPSLRTTLRREGWFPLMEAQLIEDKKADVHIIPGNHITSRAKYLSVLAEHLSTCLSKVHE